MYCVCICMYICMYNYVYLCKTSCICPVGRISVLVCIVAHNDCWCISVQAEPAPPLPQFLSCASILFYNYLFPEKNHVLTNVNPEKRMMHVCTYCYIHMYVLQYLLKSLMSIELWNTQRELCTYVCMNVCTFAVL